MAIDFFSENIDFACTQTDILNKWIENTIKLENFIVQEINIVFTSDEYLLEINKKFLNHDFYTDVITFDSVFENNISGDLFISIDRVKENAEIFKTTFSKELYRVIIHGILHLLGYKDDNDDNKKIIRQKEDFYLQKLNIIENKF